MLDLDALDRDAVMPVDPLDLLFARATASHLRELVVAGRSVVSDGKLTSVDLDGAEAELRARFRQDVGRYAELDRGWPCFDAALRHWFQGCAGCG
ncbi:hypothetical protein [Chenggangzhangella methanolivorans]|uniref:hypothetical protein n=1 Tax=Chenggangzhangella methanolivorans TaxID=1437009 RepID=UPI0028F3F5E3|nr:hypothetical protein [Chenggangzhangella methanolivorans]